MTKFFKNTDNSAAQIAQYTLVAQQFLSNYVTLGSAMPGSAYGPQNVTPYIHMVVSVMIA